MATLEIGAARDAREKSHSATDKSHTGNLNGATGLRGLACLIVLVIHALMYNTTWLMPLLGVAAIGVWLFFVLSAFLLTYQLERRGFTRATIADYCVGRVLRILPLFWLVIIIGYITGTTRIDTTDDLFAAFTMTRLRAHLWTIPVEFKAYAFIPVVAVAFIWLRNRYGLRSVVGITILATCIQQWFYPWNKLPPSANDTAWFIPCFLFGCLGAVAIGRWQSAVSDRVNFCLAFSILAFVIISSPAFLSAAFGITPSAYLSNKHVPISLLALVLILSVTTGAGIVTRILSSGPMLAVGSASYSIYLIHYIFVKGFAALWPPAWLPQDLVVAATACALSIAVGSYMHKWLEQPLERLRHAIRIHYIEVMWPSNSPAPGNAPA